MSYVATHEIDHRPVYDHKTGERLSPHLVKVGRQIEHDAVIRHQLFERVPIAMARGRKVPEDELIAMYPPRGGEEAGYMWQMKRAMYGTRRASRLFQEEMKGVLKAAGCAALQVCHHVHHCLRWLQSTATTSSLTRTREIGSSRLGTEAVGRGQSTSQSSTKSS